MEVLSWIVSVLLIITVQVIVYFYYKKTVKSFIILGPKGSGKTRLFFKMIHNKEVETHTSMKQNVGTLVRGNDRYQVVDIPGSVSLRYLVSKYLPASNILFLVETTESSLKDAALYLFEIFNDVQFSKSSVLILYRGADFDKKKLESGIQMHCETKENNLNKPFSWDYSPVKVQFMKYEDDVAPVLKHFSL